MAISQKRFLGDSTDVFDCAGLTHGNRFPHQCQVFV